MRTRILVTLKPVDGALVRVLALAERRGFSIRDLTTRLDGGFIDLELEVASDRSVDNLCRQLAKLHDVERVTPPPAPSPELPFEASPELRSELG